MPISNGNGSSLSPDSKVRLPLGFLIQIVTMIVIATVSYVKVQADVSLAMAEVHRIAALVAVQGELITTMRLNQSTTQQKLDDFREAYERDMQRYIREPRHVGVVAGGVVGQ